MLRQACADAAQWPAHLKVSVNLSVAQFAQGDIVEDIRSALSRAGLRPDRLVVEITESLLLTENTATIDTLHRLKALGVHIAMDDFGTGYSSLSYLRKYPVRPHQDRSRVRQRREGRHDQNAAIIRTIVNLGASLGMTTVAEGVETDEELLEPAVVGEAAIANRGVGSEDDLEPSAAARGAGSAAAGAEGP